MKTFANKVTNWTMDQTGITFSGNGNAASINILTLVMGCHRAYCWVMFPQYSKHRFRLNSNARTIIVGPC